MHKHNCIPSDKKGYEKCTICGTYHSTELKSREELYENDYWSHDNGRSTMEEQVYNLTETHTAGISKIDKVLGYMPNKGRLLEVGCAPGILMKKAMEAGHQVIGIEPDWHNIKQIRIIAGEDSMICHGYFPECAYKGWDLFDYIVAMDIFEHIVDYKNFLIGVFDHLKDGGKFIFMSPIIYPDGRYREIDFIPSEHENIFTLEYIRELLQWAGFSEAIEDRWKNGHEVIVAIK